MAVALVVVFAMAFMTACGGTRMDGGNDGLVGVWDWVSEFGEMEWWTFNQDGTGRMPNETLTGTMAIRWTTDGSTLRICGTPGDCGNSCRSPEDFPFRLTGDSLTVTIDGVAYTYERR
jgi:hypothetical protein